VNTKYDVAIIGAGPAGIASALQLKRFGINLILFEMSRIGGLLNNAYLVENYPGFPKGISGTSLVKKFRQHLKKSKINIVKEQVFKVTKERDNFILHAKRNYKTKILIIGSGTKPKYPKLNLNGFDKRIFFEVYPIKKKRNKKIIVVGAGDAALDYALNLGKNNKVTIINRGKKIKGLDLLFKRIKQSCYKKNITYMPNTNISAIKQLNNYLIIKVLNKRRKESLVCDYVLFAIGREPAIDFLSLSLRRKFPDGNKNLYFIGDVRQGNMRQTGIAIGDGIQAAMKIHKHLSVQSVK
jgi:thioredoxin reductase (NADPH)